MPQMSPMSWLLIMTLLFFMVSMMINTFKNYKKEKTSKKTFNKKNKSLMW